MPELLAPEGALKDAEEPSMLAARDSLVIAIAPASIDDFEASRHRAAGEIVAG